MKERVRLLAIGIAIFCVGAGIAFGIYEAAYYALPIGNHTARNWIAIAVQIPLSIFIYSRIAKKFPCIR